MEALHDGDWLRDLESWVDGVREVSLLEELARFDARGVHSALARRASVWSLPLLERILEAHEDMSHLIASNESLSAECRDRLAEWSFEKKIGGGLAMERLVSHQGRVGEELERRLFGVLESGGVEGAAAAARYFLAKESLTNQEEEILLRHALSNQGWNEILKLMVHPAISRSTRMEIMRKKLDGHNLDWFYQAGKSIGFSPEVQRVAAMVLAERNDSRREIMADFLAVPADVLKTLAHPGVGLDFLKSVARHESAWQDPEMHALLAGSRSPEVLLAYARRAPAAEAARIFKSFVNRLPDKALLLLEDPEADLSAIKRTDVAPLLTQKSGGIRERVFRIIGRLERSGVVSVPEREESSEPKRQTRRTR